MTLSALAILALLALRKLGNRLLAADRRQVVSVWPPKDWAHGERWN